MVWARCELGRVALRHALEPNTRSTGFACDSGADSGDGAGDVRPGAMRVAEYVRDALSG